MPVHIDLAGLRGELSSARDELEQWAHKLASDAKKDKHAHDLQMEHQSGERVWGSSQRPCRCLDDGRKPAESSSCKR